MPTFTNLQTNTIQATNILITLNHIPTTISSVYCPPRPVISFQQTEQNLISLGQIFLIGGDFNAKHSQWDCQVQNIIGRMFQNIMQNPQTHKLYYYKLR